jgi:cytochrome c-type biogenesis protein CcmH
LPRSVAFILPCLWLLAAGAPSASLPDGVDQVTGQLICDCGCNNLTIKDCTCGKADRVRADVAAKLSAGQTPEQVVKAYVDEYGEQILAAPTREGFNLVGWIAPFAAVLLGAGFLVLALRRWARMEWQEAPFAPPLTPEAAAPPDPSFLKRVQEELDREEF